MGIELAELTTTDGFKYNFEPSAIFAVADRDYVTGDPVTCVYGVTATYLKISEPVKEFLARFGITNNFVVLTSPNNRPIWIAAAAVSSVTGASPPEYSPPIKSVITAHSKFGVIEDPETAVDIINSRRKGNPL